MNDDQTNPPEHFPPSPAPPTASDLWTTGKWDNKFHEAISRATGASNPSGPTFSGVQKKVEDRTFEQVFPGQKPLTDTERHLMDIRDRVQEIKTAMDSLPTNIAQAMGGR